MNDIINLPPSKSIGARYFVASFFAGTLESTPILDDCDDLKVIRQALIDLNHASNHPEEGMVTLDVHASGTAFRFMAATAASTPGVKALLTGTPRLCARPMAPLVEVLRKAGAEIKALGENETGPYEICGRSLAGGAFDIRGDVSSQFISALMLVSPTWEGGMQLNFTTPLVSRPYAEMTARMMREFNIDVTLTEEFATVKKSKYEVPADYVVEADWSAAGFIYEAASMMSIPVSIAHLVSPGKSMQGDSATARIFTQLGVESYFSADKAEIMLGDTLPESLNLDMTDTPDLVPAMTAACVFDYCRFRFTGVRNLRLKESDRLEAMRRELEKFGYLIEVEEDSIAWNGGRTEPRKDFEVATYDDHRIAMAFAIAALRAESVTIADPDVVEKSFADFWNQLPKLGLVCRREGERMIVERERK